MEPCDLCDTWPGGVFDFSRPCCWARWLKRQPPHVDRKQQIAMLADQKGREFIDQVRAVWANVD